MPLDFHPPVETPDETGGVRFRGKDADTRVIVPCVITSDALEDVFQAHRSGDYVGTFRANRGVIYEVASDKYDTAGKPPSIRLTADDFR